MLNECWVYGWQSVSSFRPSPFVFLTCVLEGLADNWQIPKIVFSSYSVIKIIEHSICRRYCAWPGKYTEKYLNISPLKKLIPDRQDWWVKAYFNMVWMCYQNWKCKMWLWDEGKIANIHSMVWKNKWTLSEIINKQLVNFKRCIFCQKRESICNCTRNGKAGLNGKVQGWSDERLM